MATSWRTWRVAVTAATMFLVLGVGYWYFAFRPALAIRNALRLMIATQVGKTTVDEFRKMAIEYDARLEEGEGTFGIERRNHALEYFHLALPTIVRIHADVRGGVIDLIEVRAWVGVSHEYANIQIREFDTLNTGCGAVPECIKPYSSTMLTSVFFVPNTPLARREHLLSLNYWCLARIGGCRSSRKFFPAAWEGDIHNPQTASKRDRYRIRVRGPDSLE